MYNVEKIKSDLITNIKSQITEPIINCPLYDPETDTWEKSTDPMKKSIEAVVGGVFDGYVAVHIAELHPDTVFGVYETEDSHDTEYFDYEDLDIESLYEISNYLEKRKG